MGLSEGHQRKNFTKDWAINIEVQEDGWENLSNYKIVNKSPNYFYSYVSRGNRSYQYRMRFLQIHC